MRIVFHERIQQRGKPHNDKLSPFKRKRKAGIQNNPTKNNNDAKKGHIYKEEGMEYTMIVEKLLLKGM